MGNDAENETTQEKGGVGRDAHPGLAGELGNELVAPGEDEERGRLATKRTRPSGGDEEDPDADTGPACELKLESREGKNRSGGERRIHRRSSSEKKGKRTAGSPGGRGHGRRGRESLQAANFGGEP
jgi:hypothetical protein